MLMRLSVQQLNTLYFESNFPPDLKIRGIRYKTFSPRTKGGISWFSNTYGVMRVIMFLYSLYYFKINCKNPFIINRTHLKGWTAAG